MKEIIKRDQVSRAIFGITASVVTLIGATNLLPNHVTVEGAVLVLVISVASVMLGWCARMIQDRP